MIMEFVRFERPEGFTDADLLEDARSTVDHWRANPSLIRKHFITDGPRVIGVYIWPDLASAETAHDETWQAAFKARTGVTPSIERFEMFMEIDNAAGEVREFSILQR